MSGHRLGRFTGQSGLRSISSDMAEKSSKQRKTTGKL